MLRQDCQNRKDQQEQEREAEHQERSDQLDRKDLRDSRELLVRPDPLDQVEFQHQYHRRCLTLWM